MLYKKELEEVPILKYIRPSGKKRYSYSVSVEIVTLPRSGEILVADFFSVPDKRLSLRFFSDGKNYKTLIGFPERIWTERNPRTTCDDVYSTEEIELSRKVEPENTQNITAAIFADGVERSGTESANFGGYAASPRAASRNCSGGSPSGFDVYTLKRL